MFFYFLGFVLALVTIFGLVHTRTASERLHLQNFCVWSSSTVRRQLQEYNLFGFENRSDDGNPVLDIVEITLTQVEATPEPLENASSSDEPIEEIRAIKLGAEEENSSTTEEPVIVATPSNIPIEPQPSESRDSVLSAINASLRRLSSVANSGRINGAQLYQILLRETLRHEKTVKPEDSEMSDASSSNTVTLEAAASGDENNNSMEPKIQMYFGEKPMDYVPHQK